MMLDLRFGRRIRKGACSLSQPWSPRTAEMAKILAINAERLAILAHNAAMLANVSAAHPYSTCLPGRGKRAISIIPSLIYDLGVVYLTWPFSLKVCTACLTC